MILNITIQILGFIGALCLLLFGMNMLSNGIQKGAGGNLQKLLERITGNRFSAVLTGIGVTAIIQSSGATTVMVVSFVNAEILTLQQAIGVVFGANIGTTVTAWIVSLFGFSFSISAMAVPLFGAGFILKYFKRFKIHNFSDCFMGFALLFIGLGLLKESLTLSPSSIDFIKNFSSLGFLGLLIGLAIGAFVTALIHSSSAMTAIVLTMAANNSLTWELSGAIILGSNIGSTIDAVMSSMGATINAKRTALVHVGFNVIGTLLTLCVFKPFLNLVDLIVPGSPASNITSHIAMLHTLFNTCATLIFIPFVDQIAFLTTKIIKEKPNKIDLHYKMPAILPFSHASADLYAFQIQKEISKMAAKIMEMFDNIGNAIRNESVEKESENIEFIENYIDEMNDEITRFLQNCTRLPNANLKDRNLFAKLIHVTDTLENLSDECRSVMHTLQKYTNAADFKNSPVRKKEIMDYLELVRVFYEDASLYFTLGITNEQKNNFLLLEQKINDIKKRLKKDAQKRIEKGGNVKAELQYIDIIRKIEKAGDCVFSICKMS